jgi:hypothetical protein
MSKMSEEAREKSRAKAERLVRADPTQRVDASGYRPDGAMDADVQTGPRVISRRQFRHGGKVDGVAAAPRADRKPRASGGRAKVDGGLINEDVKEANQERDGIKHVGGMRDGGRARAHKLMGGALTPQQRMGLQQRSSIPSASAGPMVRPMVRKAGGKVHADEAQDKKLIHKMGCECAKCSGGRVGRKDGGGNWMEKAVKHPGAFSAKAKHAGMSTEAFADKVTKPGSKATEHTKREATLAKTFEKERPGKKAGGAINDGTRPTGGRLARKGGGRTKKGTNVNIIITQPGGVARPPMPPPAMARPPGAPPVGMAQGMPPQGTVPMPPPGATTGIPPAAPLMPRASGGRTLEKDGGKPVKPGAYPIDAGGGGGLARLEKAERAART